MALVSGGAVIGTSTGRALPRRSLSMEFAMRRSWSAVGLLGLAFTALAGVPVAAGEKQTPATELPACYADVFKTKHTKLVTVYGTPEPEIARGRTWHYTADGKRVVTSRVISRGEDRCEDSVITVREVESDKRHCVIHVKKGRIQCLSVAPDGKRAFGAWSPGETDEEVLTLAVWDLESGKELRRWTCAGSEVSWVVMLPDGRRGLTSISNSPVALWDLETGKQLRKIYTDGDYPSVSADGRFAAFPENDDGKLSIKIWDLAPGKLVRAVGEKTPVSYTLALSPDGKQLAAALLDEVKIWDTATGKVLGTLPDSSASNPPNTLPPLPTGGSIQLAVSRDGKKLAQINGHSGLDASGWPDRDIYYYSVAVWELAGAKKRWSVPLPRLAGHLDFTADDRQVRIVSGSFVMLLDAATGKVLHCDGGEHRTPVSAVVLSPDGKTLYSAGTDRTIQRWDAITGRPGQAFLAHAQAVTCLALSADGKHLLSGSNDRSVKLWDAATGQPLRTFSGHTDRVTGVAFSRDGKRALSGGTDRTVRLWDVAAGKELRLLEGHAHGVSGVALAADAWLAISSSADHTLRIWDQPENPGVRKPQVLKGHQDEVTCVALSADGSELLSGSQDHTVKLWDVLTGWERKTLRGHKNWVTAVCFSPNGKLAVSVSDDLTVRVWDLASGREVDRIDLGQCGDCGRCVTFAPDGCSFLVGTANWAVLRFALTGGTGK